VYSLPRAEEKTPPLNGEWVLCVTAYDTQSLPPEKRILGDLAAKSILDSIGIVERRFRVSPEYAWYESYAWSKSRQAAAQALETKQQERDNLLYKGDPDWKYRKNLKTIDAEIEKLEEAMRKADREIPAIEREPVFKFADANASGTFPAPPKAGEEYQFCKAQKADAVLSAVVSEYYNRVHISLRVYGVFTGSYFYEDSIIFSSDDMTPAMNELSGRLWALLSGKEPAFIAVRTKPENALVLINNSYAGRGEITEREYPPGKVTVAVSAEDHIQQNVETELQAGVLTEIEAVLPPQALSTVDISIDGGEEEDAAIAVYRGALYVGEAPLTLRLPVNQFEYINAEVSEKKRAAAVLSIPRENGKPLSLSLKPKNYFPPEQRRVEKSRRRFYSAWGRLWLAAPAAFLAYGFFNNYHESLMAGSQNTGNTAMYDGWTVYRNVSVGAIIAAGLFAAESVFRMARYLYVSTSDTIPIE
jgi:hypothetical protein